MIQHAVIISERPASFRPSGVREWGRQIEERTCDRVTERKKRGGE
jgi:hypothetical protein